ncbi:MAG: prephenate dehydrogenase, partial [Fretibacterium sp.]|nr:prephenate dehydrogenase [Fretibacterium sp.]
MSRAEGGGPLVDVIVPGPWWNALTYEADGALAPGARVRVPVGKGVRVGFVLGLSRAEPKFQVRRVLEVLDRACVLNADLWDLALWMGRAFLCGAGLALKALCPPELLAGEPVPDVTGIPVSKAFRETHCFLPWDEERWDFYRCCLEEGGRTLLLFSEARAAKTFFASLPASLRSEALLWPSSGGRKLWNAWRAARAGEVRLVIAPPGGVFAPLTPDRIIVEEEASPAYIFQRPPRVSARSLAGRRASTLGAELVLGGRMPSSKTFLRIKPSCTVLPGRKKVIVADVRRSLEGQERGVEGTLPLTVSLLTRTRAELSGGRHVLWVLDRRGEAGEVFCAECGHAVRCPRCGGTMRSEESGRRLRCVRCGAREDLPSRCPDCQGELWSGRRPGLEALTSMAGRLVRGVPVLLHEGKTLRPEGPSLILGTRGALALCDTLDVGLAAWLDMDAELRRPDYGARFQAFSMVWESCWRGRNADEGERDVLIQSRRGAEWRGLLAGGWERFWRRELTLRSELGLPPFGLM